MWSLPNRFANKIIFCLFFLFFLSIIEILIARGAAHCASDSSSFNSRSISLASSLANSHSSSLSNTHFQLPSKLTFHKCGTQVARIANPIEIQKISLSLCFTLEIEGSGALVEPHNKNIIKNVLWKMFTVIFYIKCVITTILNIVLYSIYLWIYELLSECHRARLTSV